MKTTSIEKRIEKLEERLTPKGNRPFLFSDLSEEEAAAVVEFHKNACQVFFLEFGGKPPVEPAQGLPIHEEACHWARESVNVFIALTAALGGGGVLGDDVVERARTLPELVPLVELAETCFRKQQKS
jgi:hypothetical protein